MPTPNCLRLFAAAVFTCLSSVSATRAALDSNGTFLAIDASAFETVDQMSLSLVEARKHSGNPLLRTRKDGPDEWRAGFPWVLLDGGKFRMWYMGRDGAGDYFTCYAESEDGYAWEYPKLGLVEHRGSKANNICHKGHALMTSIYRDDEATDPARRYVGVVYGQITREHFNEEQRQRYGDLQPSVKGFAFSADGLRWTEATETQFPIPAKVEGGVLYRMGGTWFMAHQQNAGEFAEVNRGSRFLRTSSSKDLKQWRLDNRPAFFFDPRFRGALQTHVTPGYLNYGNVIVAAQGMFYDNDELIDHETDLTLILSNDGQQWRQPKPQQPLSYLLRRGDRESWDRSFVVQGNFVNTGTKTRLYYNGSQWGNVDADGIQIGVAELWLDGYGSLAPKIGWDFGKAGPFTGKVITKPITILESGLRLYLNVQAGAAEGDAVEAALMDEAGAALPGFGFEDCTKMNVSSVGVPVSWQGKTDLTELAGKRVKVGVRVTGYNPERTGKVRVQEPQLYALYFGRPKLWLGQRQSILPGGVERQHLSDPRFPVLEGVDMTATGPAEVRLAKLDGRKAELVFTGTTDVRVSGAGIKGMSTPLGPLESVEGGWRLSVQGATTVRVELAP